MGVTTYVLQFLTHLRKLELRHVGPLSAKERHIPLQEWIKTCQTLIYSDEIANLTSQSQFRLALIWQVRLFLNSNGLLHCGGRIHNVPLDDLAKFPSLLPPRHPLSKLIIHVHVKQLHSGVNTTVTALRQTFWITSIHQHVRKQLKHCVTHQKLEGAAYRQGLKNIRPGCLGQAKKIAGQVFHFSKYTTR